MKKWLFFIVLGIVLHIGIGDFYEDKKEYVNRNVNENFAQLSYTYNQKEAQMRIFRYAGERDIVYHFQARDELIALNYSGSTNFMYNVSYIVNAPAKLIHHGLLDIKIIRAAWSTASEHDSEGNLLWKETLTKGEFWMVTLFSLALLYLDVFYVGVGLLGAGLMTIVGTLAGTLFHPILTFSELLVGVKALLTTIFMAFKNILFW